MWWAASRLAHDECRIWACTRDKARRWPRDSCCSSNVRSAMTTHGRASHEHHAHRGHARTDAAPPHDQPNAPTGSVEGAPADTVYTCPMHPQIRRPAPGNCPICGMALEPVMPTLADGPDPELVSFQRRFWWTLPLTVVVTALAMAGHYLPGLSVAARTWLELALTV